MTGITNKQVSNQCTVERLISNGCFSIVGIHTFMTSMACIGMALNMIMNLFKSQPVVA